MLADSEHQKLVLMRSLDEQAPTANVILQDRPVEEVTHCIIMGPLPRHPH